MGYSSDSERPAKRLKSSLTPPPHHYPPSTHRQGSSIASTAAHDMSPDVSPDMAFSSWSSQSTGPDAFFGGPVPFQHELAFHSPPQEQPTLPPHPSLSQPPPLSQPPLPQPSLSQPPPLSHQFNGFPPVADTASGWPLKAESPPSALSNHSPAHDPAPAAVTPPYSAGAASAITTSPVDQAHHSQTQHDHDDARSTSLRPYIRSPFEDCVETFAFGNFKRLEFVRPEEGFINGYVKVSWPSNKQQQHDEEQQQPLQQKQLLRYQPTTTSVSVDSSFSSDNGMWAHNASPASTGTVATRADTLLSGSTAHSPLSSDFPMIDGTSISISPEWTGSFSSVSPPQIPAMAATENAMMLSAKPRMVPPQFGLQSKMETSTDRGFWKFYVHNWCPGRSILNGTNLWLNDFAKMQENDGVRAAIQSLAGVYIYDYAAAEHVRKRINELFRDAEARLTELLNDPDILQDDKATELITITVILSMQDVVLTERRRKKPHLPRWLEGFLRCEYALQLTDPGSRFWHPTNVQLTSLRISQCIIVGRSVILAQPMMPLPEPQDFDPRREAKRFGWLLYGTEREMYEIHGGCGFSKKLLHIMAQVTYCSTRIMQEHDNPIAPVTADFILKELDAMRQWSTESRSWEDAKGKVQTVQWVRTLPQDYKIDQGGIMTDVTAEAWRVAAIIYLQCRAMRLPRNHPEVLGNLNDLSRCIEIMPTSGKNFTAQAPLFPVFLLGLLGTDPRHVAVSRNWFVSVVKTPVRSSVPPLYSTLQRIWSWMPQEIPLESVDVSPSIGLRNPWWEHLVARVYEREPETLCLT